MTFLVQADLLSRSSLSSSKFLDDEEGQTSDLEGLGEMFDERLELLNQVCRKYSNPLRGESQGLLSLPIDEPRCRFIDTFFACNCNNLRRTWGHSLNLEEHLHLPFTALSCIFEELVYYNQGKFFANALQCDNSALVPGRPHK